jgi:succinyl-diaminopimelate desuccinylase
MTQTPDPAAFLKALIACRSVTPAEGGAQAWIADQLAGAGFAVELLTFSAPGTPDVDNLFATIGSGAPHLVFNGHSDVVPPGNEARWRHPPFAGETASGLLYGRGAVDMKGGIACFMAAALGLVAEKGKPAGTLSLVITGDEEGPAVNGTVKALAWALEHGHRFDAALVGEPTSRQKLGDTVKVGRRGSLSGTITASGRQGHAAYPHLADNPLPRLVHVLGRLAELTLDKGSADFEPSNLEITSIDTGNPAFNVIPAEARACFNVRFNDGWTSETLTTHLRSEIDAALAGAPGKARVTLAIEPGASESFLTPSGPLIDSLSRAIGAVAGIFPSPSTGGGTSDARFFKGVCPVVEFGLVGDTMHQVDERVPLADLDQLTAIYRAFLDRFFAADEAGA